MLNPKDLSIPRRRRAESWISREPGGRKKRRLIDLMVDSPMLRCAFLAALILIIAVCLRFWR